MQGIEQRQSVTHSYKMENPRRKKNAGFATARKVRNEKRGQEAVQMRHNYFYFSLVSVGDDTTSSNTIILPF